MNNFIYVNDDGKLTYDGGKLSSIVRQAISNIDDINVLWWLRSEINVTLDARFAERTEDIIQDAIRLNKNNEK